MRSYQWLAREMVVGVGNKDLHAGGLPYGTSPHCGIVELCQCTRPPPCDTHTNAHTAIVGTYSSNGDQFNSACLEPIVVRAHLCSLNRRQVLKFLTHMISSLDGIKHLRTTEPRLWSRSLQQKV